MIATKSIAILFIVTSHSFIGDTDKKTGVWLDELSTPYYEFVNKGYEIDIVSISGGKVPLDPNSTKDIKGQSGERFLNDKAAMEKINNTKSIDKIDASKYDVVYLPGGHGTMWDFPTNQELANIIASSLSNNKIVVAVCHGPSGLVGAKFSDGTSVVKGRKISTFTDNEEKAMKLENAVPFMLETRLRELGATIKSVENFAPIATEDNNLITGQNPASSKSVADLVIKKLEEKSKKHQ